jgi:hypothetical protein
METKTKRVRLSVHEYYLRRLAKDPDYNKKHSRNYKLRHPGKVGKLVDKWCHEHLPQHNAGCNARRLTKLKDYCEFCEDTFLLRVRHHFDYTKPLEVTTLCVPCHKAVHRIMKDYGFQEPTEHVCSWRFCGNCIKAWPNCGRKVPLTGKQGQKKRSCVSWQGPEPQEIIKGDYIFENCVLACNKENTVSSASRGITV